MSTNAKNLSIFNKTASGHHQSPCSSSVSNAEEIFQILVYCFIFLGSLCGNVFIISIVYKHRVLRKTVNYFIVNMAVSDVIFALVLFPVEITSLATDWRWHVSGILGSILCKFVDFAKKASLLVSVQSLVWIAIDRFVAVVFPIKLAGLISTKVRSVAIISTWILASAFNFPSLITWELTEHGNNTFCSQAHATTEALATYLWLNSTLFIIAPFILITFLYTSIAFALARQSRTLAYACPNDKCRSFKKRKRAILMSSITMLLFYICVIPHMLIYFIYKWRPSCTFLKIFSLIGHLSFYSSCMVNPIICLSFVESYRRGLRNILCSCFRKPRTDIALAKGEQITLKKFKLLNHPESNNDPTDILRTSKDTENLGETLDTAL